MKQRVGLGWDLHRLVEGRPCLLGGIEIENERGPAGHSDGDAVLHAVSDALLGAAGLDDLGSLFPDTDPRWKNASSSELTRAVVERVHQAGWRVVNADVVIATDEPRIGPHRARMRTSLAALLAVETDAVNVKGKSLESFAPLAGGQGISVHAVCLLESTRSTDG